MTSSDLAGVSTDTLRDWVRWWSHPRRSSEGAGEAGRDPAAEVAKLEAEIRARETSDASRKPRERRE